MTGPLRVRMGLHTCEAELRDGDYYGSAVNRAARLMSVAHGGQIGGVGGDERAGAWRRRSSWWIWASIGCAIWVRPERVFQVAHPELEREFPALRSVDELAGNLPVQPNRLRGPGRVDRADRGAGGRHCGGDAHRSRWCGQDEARGCRSRPGSSAEFPDGAWFVDLAPVNTADRVAAVVLETLGVHVGGRRRRRDAACVPGCVGVELLLVVDNCEHLVASVATVADAISTTRAGRAGDRHEPRGSRCPGGTVWCSVPPLATEAGGGRGRVCS